MATDLTIDRALAAVRQETDGAEEDVRNAEKYEWPHFERLRAHLSALSAWILTA